MENAPTLSQITEYSKLLDVYGVEYLASGSHWQVGKITKTQGWIIHLSVIEPQIIDLLQLVIPWLIARGLPFKIVLSETTARDILNGALGYNQLGKIISIYPESDSEANSVAKELIKMTSRFRGPAIPTDRHLGSIVYTRYGSFNPVVVADGNGQLIKCINDASGRLMADPYIIPFSLPKGIAWPFIEVVSPELPREPKLLNGRYYPLFNIKPDAKGNVMKALYFEKFWRISPCIIKQGHPDMVVDVYGRDMRDKLKWQFDLYRKLKAAIPLPKIFDYFVSASGDAYLAMEYIKGNLLSGWIQDTYKDRCWLHLSSDERIKLLDKLLTILDIIHRMHECGFVHRDITSDNFMMDKKENIFLIDMELSWSIHDRFPDPPFGLGTPGHMSPEQRAIETPTIKEDIYGLGGLMTIFFTNIHPLKFQYQTVEQRRQSLIFFTRQRLIAETISDCHRANPEDRPSIVDIRDTLSRYKDQVRGGAANEHDIRHFFTDKKHVKEILIAGLAGLASQQFLNHKGRWISRSRKNEKNIGNDQLEMELSEGWHTGMSGPLWLVGLAKKAGLPVEECMVPYKQSWDYLQSYYFPQLENKPAGLYFGSSGVACAIIQGLNSGLLSPDEATLNHLKSCFKERSGVLSLGSGVAGDGIALLQADGYLDIKFKNKLFESYIKTILNRQLKDGSWITEYNLGKPDDRITGIDYGISGILWFLLSYLAEYPNEQVKAAVVNGLKWLISNKSKKGPYWTLGSRSTATNILGFSHGTPGIALVLIKAYEKLKDPKYKDLAEEALLQTPEHPAKMDLTFAEGLVGLGGIYLEAFRVFKTLEWIKRCDWIADLLSHSYTQFEKGRCHWTLDYTVLTTADFFSGTSGILHFLIRYLNPDIVSHPLSI